MDIIISLVIALSISWLMVLPINRRDWPPQSFSDFLNMVFCGKIRNKH